MSHALVVARETSVVMEPSPVVARKHSPVVTGSDDEFDAATVSDCFTRFTAESHIAPDADPDKMDAGDLPYQVTCPEIDQIFTRADWNRDISASQKRAE